MNSSLQWKRLLPNKIFNTIPALASPLVSSIQFDLTETKEPAQPANPALRLAFDEQGCPSPAMPVTPELRTEGIHEILTGKKHHSVAEKKTAEVLKRPVHVGLFKSSESLRKNTPVSKTVTASGSDIDLPEEPGLTYSLEVRWNLYLCELES